MKESTIHNKINSKLNTMKAVRERSLRLFNTTLLLSTVTSFLEIRDSFIISYVMYKRFYHNRVLYIWVKNKQSFGYSVRETINAVAIIVDATDYLPHVFGK